MTSLGFKNDRGLGIIQSNGIHLKIMLKVFKKPLLLIRKKMELNTKKNLRQFKCKHEGKKNHHKGIIPNFHNLKFFCQNK